MTADRGPRLGRGLAALLGEKPADPALSEVHRIAARLLDPNPSQPRGPIEAESISELAASIRAQGVLQPILVRHSPQTAGRFEIIAGERRWRAAVEAGLSDIPCLIQAMDDQQSAVAALVENLQRLDLNAIEEALGFERLLTQFHITQETLADIVGKSRSHVANTLRLLKLPEAIKVMVQTGALSAGHARALLTHPSPVSAAADIVERNLSVRQAEALAEGQRDPQPTREPRIADPDILAAENELAEQLGMSVRLRSSNGRGALTIQFSRLEQLDFLIARLGNTTVIDKLG